MKFLKEITVRIFAPRNVSSEFRRVRAGRFQLHSEGNVQRVVSEILENLAKKVPDDKYEAVHVGPAKFNFVGMDFRWVELPLPK